MNLYSTTTRLSQKKKKKKDKIGLGLDPIGLPSHICNLFTLDYYNRITIATLTSIFNMSISLLASLLFNNNSNNSKISFASTFTKELNFLA